MEQWTSSSDPSQCFDNKALEGISASINQAWARPWTVQSPELVLMPVDPHFVHVYWHVPACALHSCGVDPDEHHGRYVLKLVPVENAKPCEERAIEYTVQGVRNDRDIWLPPAPRKWQAHLGLREGDEPFHKIIASNTIVLPEPAVPSSEVLLPAGAPKKGFCPEPSLLALAKTMHPEDSARVLRGRVHGKSAHFGWAEGTWYDADLIHHLICERLARRQPEGRFDKALLSGGVGAFQSFLGARVEPYPAESGAWGESGAGLTESGGARGADVSL